MSQVGSARSRSAIVRKNLDLQEQLWPGAAERLWDRSHHRGFTTLPRTMPLIMRIMDGLAPKGQPISSTYFALWCAAWDSPFVVLRPRELAYASGFGGQRAEHTWSGRMRLLQRLHFVDIKAGKAGDFTYALIFNPHLVVREHQKSRTPGLDQTAVAALIDVAHEIGAKDMIEAEERNTATKAVTLPRARNANGPPKRAAR